jgi:hypothetical protein
MSFNILDITFMMEPEFGSVPIEKPNPPVVSTAPTNLMGAVKMNNPYTSRTAASGMQNRANSSLPLDISFPTISSVKPSSGYRRATSNETCSVQSNTSNNTEGGASRKANVPPCLDKTKTLLPIDFEPSNYSIICGNKRKFFKSVGNQRLRLLVQSFIPEYSKAEGKLDKSLIVSKVMKIVREACPVGSFVAFEKGRWWQVSERTSREKVGSYFRDFLAGKYRSSSQNKIARRRCARKEDPKEDEKCSPQETTSIPSSQTATTAVLGQPEGFAMGDAEDWNPLKL